MAEVVIVGGGPAGVRAAATLHAKGLRPILIDESPRVGGQGYRAPAADLPLDMARIMESQHAKHQALHADFSAIRDGIDYRPQTLVWAIQDRILHLSGAGGASTQRFDALIVATGAMDRVMPMPGWTLPGVFTLGAAQVALKDQGCFIGRRTLFCGSSPLLALAATQYLEMEAEVAAVCDTTPFVEKLLAAPLLANAPGTVLRGLGYLRRLSRAGVPVMHGVELIAIEGEGRVEALVLRDSRGAEKRIACDAVALGYGLKPETQLADLAGVEFAYDSDFRSWIPKMDADGRAGEALYLAGDGATIGGADAAEASGQLAAQAVLFDLGLSGPSDPGLRRRVARLRRFQTGLARAFAWPAARVHKLPDDVTLCRCEAVSVGEIRRAMDQTLGPVEANRVKAITRCGMGRCQGRVCGPTLQELAAGRLRGQAPIKPVALSIASAGSAEPPA